MNKQLFRLSFYAACISLTIANTQASPALPQRPTYMTRLSANLRSFWHNFLSLFDTTKLPRGYTSTIIHLPVREQGTGAQCGFHAAFNAKQCLDAAQIVRHDVITYRPAQEIFFGNFELGFWMDAARLQLGRDNWLNEEELAFIAQEFAGLNPQQCTIIPNLEQFQLFVDAERTALINVIRDLRKKEGACHAFLLGTMQEITGSHGRLQGTYGHWIAVVVRRHAAGLTYYVMDSKNQDRTPMVNRLKLLLETLSVRQIEDTYGA